MTNAGSPAERGMPATDMTAAPQQGELTLSPREHQKLEMFHHEHPDANISSAAAWEGGMPTRRMNE